MQVAPAPVRPSPHRRGASGRADEIPARRRVEEQLTVEVAEASKAHPSGHGAGSPVKVATAPTAAAGLRATLRSRRKGGGASEAKARQAVAVAPAVAAAPVAKAPIRWRSRSRPGAWRTTPAGDFRWPARGRVIAGFGANGGNEGINIAVPEGTPVKATEAGTVTYAGSEVKGYGNLVLIRHDNGYVSAYAHNGALSVKRGETVKRGQVIATSGQTGNVTSPQLHFEIRKGATPVDPMKHLGG